jgi:hypothetical protein
MITGSTRRSNSNKWREAYSHDPARMQRLRGAGWVKASALPPSPRLVQTLLQKGWIETTKSGPKNVVLYRLTEEGLNAKKLPIPIPQRRRPSSKGKISD